MSLNKRRGKPQAMIFTRPVPLPMWVIEYEVWRDGQPYCMGSMRIPAGTEQEAQQGVDTVLRDLLSNLFPKAEVRLTSTLKVIDDGR